MGRLALAGESPERHSRALHGWSLVELAFGPLPVDVWPRGVPGGAGEGWPRSSARRRVLDGQGVAAYPEAATDIHEDGECRVEPP